MEEKLDKIIENTKSKDSFLLTLSGKGSKIEKTFEPEISISAGCHYEIAFTSLESYYSIPNINTTNNTFQISKAGQDWITITLPTGCYGLIDLNTEIKKQLKDIKMTKAVEFKANYNTFKCVMIIQGGYGVHFATKSLRTVLGFEVKTYKAKGIVKRFIPEHKVQIMTVNSILVHCDLVAGSYLNGRRAPIVHSFFPLANPGDKMVEKPVEYIYLPIPSDVIRHMSVWLTDQEQNILNLEEETVTIKFHLRSC